MSKYLRLILVLSVVLMIALFFMGRRGAEVADGSYLIIDVGGRYVEAQSSPVFDRLLGDQTIPMAALVSELTKAERDDRLAGVVFRVHGIDAGWGKAQEIRDAITRLREAGRRTVAYIELEKYGANREYYAASAADVVYMAPATVNPFAGLAAEYLFFGGLFEKIGVEIEYERVGRYKTAVEQFAAEKMSPANREMSASLLDSVEAQFVAGIAESRGMTDQQLHEIIDRAPASPEQMHEAGLIDGILYFEDVLAAEGNPPSIDAGDYAAVDGLSVGFDPVASFALVYGAGSVVTGEGGITPTGSRVLASTTVSTAIDEASQDPDIKAILFRIDSPGGSALASDIVWKATQRARARGVPVIASFSDVAASGGYYVAAGANKIVAHPGTLTGSIGVFVLRPIVGGLFDKVGIGVASMTRGAHADLLLSTEPLSPGARARMREQVQGVYELFVSRVAAGRDMEPEEVDAAGRGRVYTGEQALEVGLVDALGGFRVAVREAKLAAGLAPDDDVTLIPYPPPRPLAEQLVEALGVRVAAASLPELPLTRGVKGLLATLSLVPQGIPVLIPPFLAEIH